MPGILDAAMEYAGRGWPVLALSPNSKIPIKDLTLQPHGSRSASTDQEHIRELFTTYPKANLGVATGAASFTAIDPDGPHAPLLLKRDGLNPPPSAIVKTPNGYHLYVTYDPELQQGARLLQAGEECDCAKKCGVDVRNDGGYVVVPPSVVNGIAYEWRRDCEILPWPEATKVMQAARKRQAAHSPVPRTDGPAGAPIVEGNRDAALTSIAGSMRRKGMTVEEIAYALHAVNRARVQPPLPETDIERIARSVGRYVPAAPATGKLNGVHANGVNGAHSADTADASGVTAWITSQGKTPDLDLAEAFITAHGEEFRYCEASGGWHRWDGRRWRSDETGVVLARIKEFVTAQLNHAILADDLTIAKALLNSRQAQRINAIEMLSRSDQRVAVEYSAFDADPWLLNTPTGTINLRDGSLRPHSPADMLTKITAAPFEPGATHPMWTAALEHITGGDAEYAHWLQKAAGYTLTGDTSEEVLFFLYGKGGTGKTTVLEALKAALGDYALTADFETFLHKKLQGGPRDDVAQLAGHRMVTGVEVAEGRALAEGLVKMLTGGDTVRARMLYANSFEFKPQFKLWLAANSAPRVREDDDAMWRRIRRCPFTNKPAKPDPKIKLAVTNPHLGGPAVLAWAVQGCLDWQKERLGTCAAVDASTREYRAEVDRLAPFVAEGLRFDPGFPFIPRKAVWTAFEAWAKDNDAPLVQREKLYQRIREEGAKDHKVHVLGFTGVMLSTGTEQGQLGAAPAGNSLTRARVGKSLQGQPLHTPQDAPMPEEPEVYDVQELNF